MRKNYEAWKRHIGGESFPVPGNTHFWKSNIMTHHGSDYYMSAKVISVRTNGTEMLNGQNLKGYYLPLGATNIMTTGHEYDDAFVDLGIGHGYREQRRLLISRLPISVGICLVRINLVEVLAMLIMV